MNKRIITHVAVLVVALLAAGLTAQAAPAKSKAAKVSDVQAVFCLNGNTVTQGQDIGPLLRWLDPADAQPPLILDEGIAAFFRFIIQRDGGAGMFRAFGEDEEPLTDFNTVTEGACPSGAPGVPSTFEPPRQPPRAIYCAVEGNKNPFTGAAIRPGTALDLEFGQPDTDPNYKGAVPAIYILGGRPDGSDIGATCDPPPNGFRATVKVEGTGLYTGVEGAIYTKYVPI